MHQELLDAGQDCIIRVTRDFLFPFHGSPTSREGFAIVTQRTCVLRGCVGMNDGIAVHIPGIGQRVSIQVGINGRWKAVCPWIVADDLGALDDLAFEIYLPC